ncbi:MAG: hypothetical protein ACREM8_03935, partial [Vulcanimicrobiaceae bacterium]
MTVSPSVSAGAISPARRTVRLLVVVGALVYLAGLVWLAVHLPTWSDEEYTMHTTGAGVGQAFHRALTFELQPPLYFVAVAAWRHFGDSVAWVRGFSILCVLPLPFVLAAISRSVSPRIARAAAVGLTMLHPFVIWSAVEARGYALDLLVGSLLV